MNRPTILACLICLTTAAHAQKQIPWDEFAKEIGAMQTRTEVLRGQISAVTLGQYAKEAKVQDRHGWLSAWSGWLYLDAGDATEFHNRHREILYATKTYQKNLPATVDAKYLEYYRNGMREFEATHNLILTGFQNYARSRVGQIVAYEKDGREAMTEAEKVTAKLGEEWKKYQKRTHFQADVFAGEIPEPSILRFGPIKIDYTSWYAERSITNNDLQQTKRSIEARIKDINAKVAEITAMGREVEKLRTTYAAKATS